MSKEKMALFQLIVFCCEWIALLAGLLVWKRVRHNRYRYFVLYLAFIAAGELTAFYTGRLVDRRINILLYNWLIIPVEYIFFCWFYYVHLQGRLYRNMCLVFMALTVVIRVVELTVLRDEKFSFSSLSYLVSTVLLLLLALVYLIQFMRSDNIIYYHRHLAFWVTIGLLIYYLGSFPLFAFYNYLYTEEKAFFYSYWKIQMVLNMLLYLIFAFALVWTNIRHRYSFFLPQ